MEEKNLEQEQTESERPPFSGRTSKLVGLFAATALVVSVGCSDAPVATEQQQAVTPDGQPVDESDYCLDDNDDGYCDDDGSRISHSTFIWIGGINTGTKKYYKTSAPDTTRVYKPSATTGGSGVSAGTSGSTTANQPASKTSQPPKSASGTGQVINKSAPATSSSGSGTVKSGSSSSKPSSSSGISSSSGKGGIGSSSSSSSS